jgi:hypothetical protein
MLNGCFCWIGVSGGERVRSIPRIATCALGELFVGALRLGVTQLAHGAEIH